MKSLEKVINTLVLPEYPFIDSFEIDVEPFYMDDEFTKKLTLTYRVNKRPNPHILYNVMELTNNLFVMVGLRDKYFLMVDFVENFK